MTENVQANELLAYSYNALPYTSKVFANCQPTRLHALAKIKGLTPPALETAKVLEIGCSFGGNLLPFAIQHPKSKLIGIDLSELQINIGQQMMEQVGVKNVELVAADIGNASFDMKFDYIICHGVFSWVPAHTREAILKTIQEYLSPNGIAYISYNTYPGWKIRDIAKELMQFGSNPNLSIIERVDQGFEALKFVANVFERKNNELYKVLSDSFKEVTEQSKYYIAHEHFEKFNNPLYFKDFVAQINQYDLAYLTDSSVPAIYRNVHFENDEYDQVCQYFDYNLEAIEQFMDFINNKAFRGSLITHKQNLTPKGIINNIDQYNVCHNFHDIYLRTHVIQVPATDEKEAYWYLADLDVELSKDPITDILFGYLQEQNQPCKVADIIEQAKQCPEYDEQQVLQLILSLIHSAHVYLCFSAEKSSSYTNKPKLFETYRKFIELVHHNPEVTHLSNRYYQVIELDFFATYLAKYLDGTKTIKMLIKQVKQDLENEIIVVNDSEGNKRNSKEVTDQEIKDMINLRLQVFEECGYFNEY